MIVLIELLLTLLSKKATSSDFLPHWPMVAIVPQLKACTAYLQLSIYSNIQRNLSIKDSPIKDNSPMRTVSVSKPHRAMFKYISELGTPLYTGLPAWVPMVSTIERFLCILVSFVFSWTTLRLKTIVEPPKQPSEHWCAVCIPYDGFLSTKAWHLHIVLNPNFPTCAIIAVVR